MTDETPLEKAGHLMKAAFRVGITEEILRHSTSLEALMGPQRKGHYEESPKDPKFLSAREAWAERWKRITEEGFELGYLEQAHCYECGGEVRPTTDVVDRTWIYDETEEAFEARKADKMLRMPKSGDTVKFNVRRRES